MEERPPIRKAAANILNKQSRKVDMGRSPSLLGGWARCEQLLAVKTYHVTKYVSMKTNRNLLVSIIVDYNRSASMTINGYSVLSEYGLNTAPASIYI